MRTGPGAVTTRTQRSYMPPANQWRPTLMSSWRREPSAHVFPTHSPTPGEANRGWHLVCSKETNESLGRRQESNRLSRGLQHVNGCTCDVLRTKAIADIAGTLRGCASRQSSHRPVLCEWTLCYLTCLRQGSRDPQQPGLVPGTTLPGR